jgi:hypothetical protein
MVIVTGYWSTGGLLAALDRMTTTALDEGSPELAVFRRARYPLSP